MLVQNVESDGSAACRSGCSQRRELEVADDSRFEVHVGVVATGETSTARSRGESRAVLSKSEFTVSLRV